MTLLTRAPSLMKSVVTGTMQALGPVLSGMVDEAGVSLPTTLRANFSTDLYSPPSVTVSFRPGRIPIGHSTNLIANDDGTGQTLWGMMSAGHTIRLHCDARSEAEREWLVDTLISGILANPVLDTTVTPNVPEPNAVTEAAGALNVDWDEIGAIEYPDPIAGDGSPAGARPQGQIYRAVIPISCTVSLAWSQAPFSVTKILINGTASLGNWLLEDAQITVQ